MASPCSNSTAPGGRRASGSKEERAKNFVGFCPRAHPATRCRASRGGREIFRRLGGRTLARHPLDAGGEPRQPPGGRIAVHDPAADAAHDLRLRRLQRRPSGFGIALGDRRLDRAQRAAKATRLVAVDALAPPIAANPFEGRFMLRHSITPCPGNRGLIAPRPGRRQPPPAKDPAAQSRNAR